MKSAETRRCLEHKLTPPLPVPHLTVYSSSVWEFGLAGQPDLSRVLAKCTEEPAQNKYATSFSTEELWRPLALLADIIKKTPEVTKI